MRYRTLGLAAAVLLAAPLMASCRNPGGGGGTTTTVPGGGGLPLVDCGTIDTAGGISAAEIDSINCWQSESDFFGGYHTNHGTRNYKIVQIDGAVTSTYETTGAGHQIRVTTATAGGTTTTKTCTNEQFTHSQFVFSRESGKLTTARC